MNTHASVSIRVLPNRAQQQAEMQTGTRRLLLLNLPSPVKDLIRGLSQRQRLTLSRTPHGSPAVLLADCVAASVDDLMRKAGGPGWDRAGFERLRAAVGAGLHETAAQTLRVVEGIITDAQRVEVRLGELTAKPLAPVVAEARAHLDTLVYAGVVTGTGLAQLPHVRRYLRALDQRLADAPTNLVRDRERQATVDLVRRDLAELRAKLADSDDPAVPARLAEIGWMIEELQVSLFAQKLGTAHPVSVPRIHAAMDAVDPAMSG